MSSSQSVITINIMNFNLFRDLPAYHTVYQLIERQYQRPLTDTMECHFVEIPKLLKAWKQDELNPKEDVLTRWLLLLGTVDTEQNQFHDSIYQELEELAMRDEILSEAMENWNELSHTEEQRLAYEARLKQVLDKQARQYREEERKRLEEELARGQQELSKGQQELSKEQQELSKKRAELDKNRENLSKEQESLNKDQENLSKDQENLKRYQESLKREKAELKQKQSGLERDQSSIEQEQVTLEQKQSEIERDQQALNQGKMELAHEKAELTKEREKLANTKKEIVRQLIKQGLEASMIMESTGLSAAELAVIKKETELE
ncbi:PD-(D/E)XK nuclease family transposase [Amphibacillus sp. Q70]|uniref:PD-(D/E)XK nuclease family transposase n=1 Tax=Amphibacillus sp. Q70 TaxID=3453416 RepID=UPI003F8552F4